MSIKKKYSNSSNEDFLGILFIVFLVLKLTNVIDWSWWWVTAPLWGGIAVVIVVFLIVSIYHAIKGDFKLWLG